MLGILAQSLVNAKFKILVCFRPFCVLNDEYVNEHHWPSYVQLKIHRLCTDPGT